jgi:hypothetical protein
MNIYIKYYNYVISYFIILYLSLPLTRGGDGDELTYSSLPLELLRVSSEAVARLLKIQPYIQNTLWSSPPKGHILGQLQLYKLRPPPGATAVPGRRRGRCRSPKVDDGRLQKAVPEASLASEKDRLTLPSH